MSEQQEAAVEPAAAVASLPLFARLAVADVRSLAARGSVRRFAQGAEIFREGSEGNALYVILGGSVRVAVSSSSGGEVILSVLREGDCLGELALIDGRPRSATAIAQQRVTMLMVTRDAFRSWLGENPQVALPLLETLAGRLRATNESLADIAFLDLEQRLAKRLLALATTPGEGEPPTVRITQDALAAMLGVSRESVNKQLNAFARSGWVEIHRGWVAILEPAALAGLHEA
jgi:CRP/FNR family cyclic AMP-dependent transcriptional regulator